jgi:hypothetical protein
MLQLTFKLPASFDVVFTSGQQQQEDEDARQEQLQQLSGAPCGWVSAVVEQLTTKAWRIPYQTADICSC